MKWSNLKRNKCPECAKELLFSADNPYLHCSCGFKISEQRMAEIVGGIVTKELERDNQQDLNEL